MSSSFYSGSLIETNQSNRFYEKPYLKKILIGAVALVSTAVIGYAAYYNRECLPANPLAGRMRWVNWNNAKTALITPVKTIVVALSAVGGLLASTALVGYYKGMGWNLKVSLIACSAVVASILAGYPLGAMKTASFLSAAIAGGTIGLLVGNIVDEALGILGVIAGAGAGLGLINAALYLGLDGGVTPLISSAC